MQKIFGTKTKTGAARSFCFWNLNVATGILVKSDKLHYAWITGLPLLWLITITSTAAWQKITSDNIRLGFFSAANDLTEKLANGSLPAAKAAIAPQLILNLQIDGWITLCFVSLLWVIVLLFLVNGH